MLTIRPTEWPGDRPVLAAIDTSFTTDRIYRLVREALSFRLVEELVNPPLTKRYAFDPTDPAERRNWDFAAIAEVDGELAGFAAVQYIAWNRRAALWHLYVMPRYRRQRVGMQLLAAVDDFARSAQARCVWLETQNTNYPAIQFYRRAGFTFCGFDESLYDPAHQEREEVALFFARPIETK
jgi:ribosomal protein S18 acetylase RimI-like enzyme